MEIDSVRVAPGTSVGVTVAVTTTSYTLPLDATGTTARYVRVLPEAACYINFGTSSSVTCSYTNGIYVTPNESQVFHTKGYSYFAVIVKTTATVVSLSPIEL